MTKQLIDFGVLETYIKDIEKLFSQNNLNVVEQKLVLEETNKRIASRIQQQNVKDQLHNIPLVGNILKNHEQ